MLDLFAVAITADDFAAGLPVLKSPGDDHLLTSFVVLPVQRRGTSSVVTPYDRFTFVRFTVLFFRATYLKLGLMLTY